MIYERIRARREALNMTQKELADLVGFKTSSAVNKIEMGLRDLNQTKISLFANALHTTPSYLMGWSDNPDAENRMTDGDSELSGMVSDGIPATDLVPVYNKIAAGAPVLCQEDVIDYMPVTVKNTQEYFALVVQGESMIGAGIPNGCKVLIHKQDSADNGQIVACRLNGYEATLKRFKQVGDTILLLPENKDYEPIIVPVSQFESGEAQIIGVVRQIIVDVP